MAQKYTTAQAAVIQDAWYAVKRMVESSHHMEKRLDDCLKVKRKHFAPVAALSHTLSNVRRGMLMCHGAAMVEVEELTIRAGDCDEDILAMSLGMHYANRDGALSVIECLNNAHRAEGDAQQAFLDALANR